MPGTSEGISDGFLLYLPDITYFLLTRTSSLTYWPFSTSPYSFFVRSSSGLTKSYLKVLIGLRIDSGAKSPAGIPKSGYGAIGVVKGFKWPCIVASGAIGTGTGI